MSSNDPKSYRVPTAQLTDIIPTKHPPTQNQGAVTTPTQSTPQDEAQKLHEAFVAQAQAELEKNAHSVTPNIPIERTTLTTKNDIEELDTDTAEQKKQEEIIIHQKQIVEETVTDTSQQTEDVESDALNSSVLPDFFITNTQDHVPTKKEDAVTQNNADATKHTQSTQDEAKPVLKMTGASKQQTNETVLERIVSATAEKFDHLPEKKIVVTPSKEDDAEIAALFDSYLKEEEKKKDKKNIAHVTPLHGQDTVTEPILVPELPDIWELDAQRRKNTTQHTERKNSVTTPPSVLETIDKTTPIKTPSTETMAAEQSEPMSLEKQNSPTKIQATEQTPSLDQSMFKPQHTQSQPLQRVPYTPKKNAEKTRGIMSKLTTELNADNQLVAQNTPTPLPLKEEPDKPIATNQPTSNTTQATKSHNVSSNLETLRTRIKKEHDNETSSPEQEHEQLTKQVSKKLQILSQESSSAAKTNTQPQSKHANAISHVAERLREISQTEERRDTLERIMKNQEEAERAKETQQVTQKKVAPGEIPKKEVLPRPITSISSVRTFKQDVEQAVMKNKTSVVSMISAEEKRRSATALIHSTPKPSSAKLSYVFVGASVALLIGAAAIGIFLTVKNLIVHESENTEIIPFISKTISYNVTEKTRDDLLKELSQIRNTTRYTLGSIIEIELQERLVGSVTNDGDDLLTTNAGQSYFIEKVVTHAPQGFTHSITNSILGIHEMTVNEIFLLLKVNHRDVAFRGMFDWEEYMDVDLAPLFGEAVPRIATNNTPVENVTASTTEPNTYQQPTYEKILYEDIYIANKEVRALRNRSGELVLLWAMPDDSTVLITSSEITMKALLEQMAIHAYSSQ